MTDRLLTGALDTLSRQGVHQRDIKTLDVPGAFEIPGVAMQMGRSGRFDALICLGAVIRGETPHFDYICSEVSRGIGQVALTLGLPVIFGVLTTASLKQAMARSSHKMNKGSEAAESAIEMARLYREIKKPGRDAR